MTNFDFADELTVDPFTNSYNSYMYVDHRQSSLRFCADSENIPYIIKGFNPQGVAKDPKNTIYLCDSKTQFKGRLLNTKKIKDVMNSSRGAILVSFKDTWYYMGKGYLSLAIGNKEPKMLFVACYNGKKSRLTSLEDIKFFVCRDIFNEEHKVIQPAIKDFINNHVGDVVITNDIGNYVGESIKIPAGSSIAAVKEYTTAVVMECISDVIKTV